MTVESAADQALALKKRARRRLVGAVALVLLMLIILPNVLKDREQEELRAPITLTMPEAPQTEVEPENPVSEQLNAPSPPVEPAIASPAEKMTAPAQTPLPVSPPIETPNPIETPEKIAPTNPKSEAKNAVNPVVTTSETAKQKEAKTTRFLIQVGVFSDAENVKKLQTKISEAGFSSRTAKLNTPKGEKIRLRVGSFVTRDAAAEALKKLEAHGLSGMVLLDE